MFLKMWREECQVENFKLNHLEPRDFSICCWVKSEKVTVCWLAYRILIALYFLISFLYTVVHLMLDEKEDPSDKTKILIFLTNWTYIAQTFTFGLGYCLSVKDFMRQKAGDESNYQDKLPWHYQLFWAFYNIVLSASVNVTVLFWLMVYDPVLFPVNGPSVILHTFNSVFMILDFALAAHPIRFLHFYWPVVYAMTYLIFSVIYELAGGTGVKGIVPIYKVLDWKNNPVHTLPICLMACMGLILAHMLFSLLSLLKMWLRRKYITN